MTTALTLTALAPWLAVGAVVGLRAPAVLLAGYAAILPFGSSVRLPVGLPPPFDTATTIVGLVATAGILLNLVLTGRRARRLQAPLGWWLAFFGLVAATLVWSIDPAVTRDDLLVLASLLGLYTLTLLLRTDRHAIRVLEAGIAASGAITGLYALMLLATGTMHVGGDGIRRFQTAGGGGEGGDPNITAATLILPLVVALACGLGDRTGVRRVGYLVSAALAGAAITLTGSRGGLIAILVATITLAVNDRRPRARLVYVLIPVVAAALTFSLASTELQDRVQAQNSSGRTDIWAIGVDMCAESCGIGTGWGTFSDAFTEQFLAEPATERTRTEVGPHSIWLRTPVEAGWLAAIVMVAALGSTWRGLRSVPAVRRGPPAAAFVGLLVTNSLLSNLDFKYFWLTLMYVGLVVSAEAEEKEEDDAVEHGQVTDVGAGLQPSPV